MSKRYLLAFGLILELLAALWLIGNPSSPADAILALLLHLIAATSFSIGVASRFHDKHAGSARLALFCLSLLLPLVGPLLFVVLTANRAQGRRDNTPHWQVVEAPSASGTGLYSRHTSATTLRALVVHSRNPETRLEALHKTAKLGPHAARSILQCALNDPSELVRKTAFELLEGRNTNEHSEIGSLLEIMDENPDSLNDANIQAEAAGQLWELAYQGFADAEAIEGFLQRANAHLHRAMSRDELSPELYFQRGRIRLKLNDPAAARGDFERALHLGQGADEILPYLAECAFVEERYEQVGAHLRNLSPLRQRSGRFNKIVELWREAA